jgi:hypothetical protein
MSTSSSTFGPLPMMLTSEVIGCRSSTTRPSKSATSTAPASSLKKTRTLRMRGSADCARSFTMRSNGSFCSGRTSSQGVATA